MDNRNERLFKQKVLEKQNWVNLKYRNYTIQKIQLTPVSSTQWNVELPQWEIVQVSILDSEPLDRWNFHWILLWSWVLCYNVFSWQGYVSRELGH